MTDNSDNCAGSSGNSASDIFTCNGNATLFQIFAPAGTQHSKGKADNDQDGWGTWRGGGCFCINGNLCCASDAKVPVNVDLDLWDQIDTQGEGGNVIKYFDNLNGACSCTGDSGATNKRHLRRISSDPYERASRAKLLSLDHPESGRFQAVAEKEYRRIVIASEDPQNSDEPAHVRRMAHSPSWDKFAPKGQKYWKEFNDRDINQPDNDPCNLDQDYTTPEDKIKVNAVPIMNVRGFLDKLGIPTGPDYITVFSSWPKGDQKDAVGEFMNTFSPKDGVMIASTNNRHQQPDTVDPKTIKLITPDNWSSVAWAQWKRGCVTITPGTTDFSNLKVIIRKNIDNSQTSAIIAEAMQGQPLGEFIYFYPDDESLDNAFWPLLGSANGNGMIHLLTDHKKALDGKSITRVGVFIDPTKDNQAQIWAELTGANLG